MELSNLGEELKETLSAGLKTLQAQKLPKALEVKSVHALGSKASHRLTVGSLADSLLSRVGLRKGGREMSLS